MSRMMTADGKLITDGVRVINTDMNWGHVELNKRGYEPEVEHNEWWFYMRLEGSGAMKLVSESRVATRKPW